MSIQNDPMPDQDTEHWLAALAGNEVPGEADAATAREAEALRDTLRFRAQPARVNPRIINQVFARLEAERSRPWWTEGLRGVWPENTSPRWRLGMAVSILLVGVLVGTMMALLPSEQDNFIPKPFETARQLIVPDPRTTAQQLKSAVEKLGLEAALEQTDEGWIFKIPVLPPDRLDDVNRLFAEHGMRISSKHEQLLMVLIPNKR